MDITKAWMALGGGALIGLSSSLHYMLYGRTTGLSGFLFNVLGFKFGPLFPLRLCFLVGLTTLVDLWNITSGKLLWDQRILDDESKISLVSWVIGGLLIGVGVRWSGGCTSGHGVCGLPRKSLRSLIAVCIFMATGVGTATTLSYLPGLPLSFEMGDHFKEYYEFFPRIVLVLYQLAALVYISFHLFTTRSSLDKFTPLVYLLLGATFGLGLLISGMCSRAKILSFLTINQSWDPSLLLVMASAVGINFVTFQITIRSGKPIFGENLDMPDTGLDMGIFVGPALFGVGWGITGLCPGPALANITVLGYGLSLVILIFAGQCLCDYVESKLIAKVI